MRTEFFLIEHKFTDKRSRSLKRDEWDKLERQALKIDKIPVMQIEIDGVDLYVINENMIEVLEEALSNECKS